MSEMYGIGEMARDSGLTISALRFYDGAGVLVPAWVDPDTGYRWYGPGQRQEARLLARLRRVNMPLADIRLVLAGWSSQDTALVSTLLDAHLLRLEDGLDDARRELSTVRELLALREHPMNATGTDTTDTAQGSTPLRLTFAAPDLAAALDTVRFAVSGDPDLPMLGGVHIDIDGAEQALRLVATDRYRLAVAQLQAETAPGTAQQVIVPAALVDAMRALLTAEGEAVLTLDSDGSITLDVAGSRAAGACLDHDFPDYRRLTRLPAGRRVAVDVVALRELLTTGPTRRGPDSADVDISLLALTPDGALTVVGDADSCHADDTGSDSADPTNPGDRIAVNREFLLDALAASARDRLVLELGGPVAPLAVRLPEGEDQNRFSLLMPIRLTD
ncbi:MerR family transcriptional regulator [Streptacidiphilus sp. N1-12]|uniref:MerR family transcriptional regulator n=2 Tax=Streptacidiphilus alkalitolerans TaxID=3342712 RepID=A0ABV6V7H1_9ACTN